MSGQGAALQAAAAQQSLRELVMLAAQNHYQGLNSQGLGQAYPNSVLNPPNSVLNPQPILVQLSDETIQRVVKAILDGMQERWGRRQDDD